MQQNIEQILAHRILSGAYKRTNLLLAALQLEGISMTEVGKSCAPPVAHSQVSRVIYEVNKSRRIRRAVAEWLRIPFTVMWPEEAKEQPGGVA